METNAIIWKVRLLNYLGVVYLNHSLYAIFTGRFLTFFWGNNYGLLDF